MAASLNLSVYTGQQSLLVRQRQMSVLANNLANVDRPAYHRQTAVVQNNAPLDTTTGQIGTGIHVANVVRSFDMALETSLRQSLQQEGYSRTCLERLEQLEAVMLPSGDNHLGEAVTDFGLAWQDLATMPDNQSARVAVLGEARNIVSIVRRQDGQLQRLQEGLAAGNGSGAIADKLTTFNEYLQEIAHLNSTITRTETGAFGGMQANDLRDRRDELVANASELAEITVTEETNGSYTITLDGHALVADGALDAVQIDMSGGTPVLRLASDGTAVSVAAGEVGGLVDSWARVATIRGELDAFVVELRDLVNNQQAAGFDLDGNAGGALFGGTSAATFAVLIGDPRAVAASDTSGETGNGSGARAMWDTLNAPNANLGNVSALDYPDTWLNGVALDVSQASDSLTSNEAATAMFREVISRNSGVSLDEEMIDMLQLQRAYQASAKFISTVDELLGAALAMV